MTRLAEPAVRSVPSFVRDWSHRAPDAVAMREKSYGIWKAITWADYWASVDLVGHGLLALGIRPGDRVAIHSENRPEWLFVDVATCAVRAVSVGIYPTNPTAEVEYLLADSGSRILVAEDQEQIDKVFHLLDDLPDLEAVIHLERRGLEDYDHPKLIFWGDFLEQGRAHRDAHPGLVDELLESATPDDVVTLIYTSGTTGPPKGAMLTAANVEFAQRVLATGGFYDPPPSPDDITLSYLPLCHVAERAATTWLNSYTGCVVHFAESIETVQQNLREVQPTLFFAVPRIWEKMAATIQIRIASASTFKRAAYTFWMKKAEMIGQQQMANGGNHSRRSRFWALLGEPLLFRALRDRIGMRLVRDATSGAAPIAPDILTFFHGIGVPIREIYGMTENAAIATVNRPGRVKLGTVGEPHPDAEVKVDDATGEILTRHPGVFAGYWNKPEKTAETIDAAGWLHTGDVGELVDGTHLRIVDRIKDIIITSGGKNISPSEIENQLKTSPYIKEAVVIGDARPYLVALIGIELDVVGDWAARQRIPFTTYRDLTTKREVLTLIQGVIRACNERFARVENIRKFRMMHKELDHEDGEMTATQKIKRATMHEVFGHLIDDMYENHTRFPGGDPTNVHEAEPADPEFVHG